jgi:hypothetical protein
VGDEPVRSELEGKPLTIEEKRLQGALFGQELKEKALDRAEEYAADNLAAARLIRDRLSFEHEAVDADMVREVFERHRGVNTWGVWAGALFRDGKFEPTGEWKASTYATNHSRVNRRWRRKAGK